MPWGLVCGGFLTTKADQPQSARRIKKGRTGRMGRASKAPVAGRRRMSAMRYDVPYHRRRPRWRVLALCTCVRWNLRPPALSRKNGAHVICGRCLITRAELSRTSAAGARLQHAAVRTPQLTPDKEKLDASVTLGSPAYTRELPTHSEEVRRADSRAFLRVRAGKTSGALNSKECIASNGQLCVAPFGVRDGRRHCASHRDM